MTQTPANWATVSRPSLLTFWLLKSETEQRQSELRIATLRHPRPRHPALTAQVSTLDPMPDLSAGTWCKLGKHDPTGNHRALEKVNSAKDSFLLRVSVNRKPFSGVTNFYITVIVCMFWTLICSILPIFPLFADWWSLECGKIFSAMCGILSRISLSCSLDEIVTKMWDIVRCATGESVIEWWVNADQDPSLVAT